MGGLVKKAKKIVKKVAPIATVAAPFIPGIGPLAAAGIGAAGGLASGGGLKGALMGGAFGGLGNYGIGRMGGLSGIGKSLGGLSGIGKSLGGFAGQMFGGAPVGVPDHNGIIWDQPGAGRQRVARMNPGFNPGGFGGALGQFAGGLMGGQGLAGLGRGIGGVLGNYGQGRFDMDLYDRMLGKSRSDWTARSNLQHQRLLELLGDKHAKELDRINFLESLQPQRDARAWSNWDAGMGRLGNMMDVFGIRASPAPTSPTPRPTPDASGGAEQSDIVARLEAEERRKAAADRIAGIYQ